MGCSICSSPFLRNLQYEGKTGGGVGRLNCLSTIRLCLMQLKELTLIGIEAMHCLGESNETTQSALITDGHFDPIVKVLTQTRYLSVQVCIPATIQQLLDLFMFIVSAPYQCFQTVPTKACTAAVISKNCNKKLSRC